MTVERIISLTAPPVLGRTYLVPTVEYPWLENPRRRAWPVFLPRHEDAEHLQFKAWHYHVDPRFLSRDHVALAAREYADRGPGLSTMERAEAVAQAVPLSRRALMDEPKDVDGTLLHPAVVWRHRRCRSVSVQYQHGEQPEIQRLRRHFAGQQCKHARAGWVCPHKRFPLGSIAPDAHGVITCPLHGLRIDAASGAVLGAEAAQAVAA